MAYVTRQGVRIKRAKTMIADMYKNKCVERAISTMRAALGYETVLPLDWNNDLAERKIHDIIDLIDKSFPGREIRIWCTEDHWNKSGAQNCEFEGPSAVAYGEWNNLYLFAFVYFGTSNGHMVIGWPAVYGDMSLGLTVAVRL